MSTSQTRHLVAQIVNKASILYQKRSEAKILSALPWPLRPRWILSSKQELQETVLEQTLSQLPGAREGVLRYGLVIVLRLSASLV
jgi:hypothetical protein